MGRPSRSVLWSPRVRFPRATRPAILGGSVRSAARKRAGLVESATATRNVSVSVSYILVLDAGAFAAVERGDRGVVALVKRERLAGRVPVTTGGVVAQVWRGGRGRQVPVARLLAGTDVAAIDDPLGRRAGLLLARSGQRDAIDATVVCLAADGDDILTSDPRDLRVLAEAADIHVDLSPV